ncbi:MAG: hypothetical protein IH790_02160 [Acidobacteria bacterium]|nr:hypothetical protein [Acidobacteriota bacterium]
MSSADGYRVGILGASGYAGAELMRLCAQHPSFEIAFASAESQAGVAVGSLYPSLAADYVEVFPDAARADDVVFVARSLIERHLRPQARRDYPLCQAARGNLG